MCLRWTVEHPLAASAANALAVAPKNVRRRIAMVMVAIPLGDCASLLR